MTTPRLYFLGIPKFERDGQTVELTSAKAIALLAYLASTRVAQSRERLLGLLWAESSEDAARKNLRNTLWSIRKVLGDAVITGAEDRLSLGVSVWVDVHALEGEDAPQSAPALYRGPFLDGLELADAPEFEIWLTGERERLAQVYARALAMQVEQLRAAADWRGVIEVAGRALAQDNLNEPMHRALMEAHARLGQRADALRDYQTLQTALERELGVVPLEETNRLRTAILNGELAGPESTPARRPVATTRMVSPSREPFIGRRAERLALDAALQETLTGQARIVLLVGEVGIGKSRLWREWSADLSPSATVLGTRCLDSTQSLPFAPLLELFREPALTRLLTTTPSPISPVWLAEVARLVPEVCSAQPGLPPPAALPPEEERRRLFEAITQCLLALQAHPLVLFFDDLHWADRATLDWLDYAVHRLNDQPILIVAAYRAEEAPSHLVHLIVNWGRERLAHKIPLARLTPAESAALIAALGGDPAISERVQNQSAGNPYFLIELQRSAPSEIPPVLTDLIRARLDRLPEMARQVLQAAAVLGRDFDVGTLRQTSGRSEEETLEAIDTLLAAHVLRERDGSIEFAHPLIPTVVQSGMSAPRRGFMHRRAARALEAIHARRLPQVAGALAGHYAEAGERALAAHYAQMAAEQAAAMAAPDEAIDFYHKALELEPSPAREAGLGRALLRVSELDAARAAFESALKGFEASGDTQASARVALNLSETYYPSGRFEEGRQWILKALEYAGGENDPESHALAHLALGSGQVGPQWSFADAERNLNEAARHAVQAHLPGIAARARLLLGNLRAERGDLEGAIKAYAETIEFAHAAGDEFEEILGHNNYAYHALLLGDRDAAHAQVDEALALAEARGLRLPLQNLYSTQGEIALAEEQWDTAEEWLRRALAEAERNRNPREVANDRANLARALARGGKGDLDGALVLLESARETAAGAADPHLQTRIELELAELLFARGERTAARAALARADRRLAGTERKQLQAWAERLKRLQRPAQG